MKDAGFYTYFDTVGNLYGRIEGRTKDVILAGSHRDTVKNGGKYDGALGIITAISACTSLYREYGIPEKTVEVVALCEEEASRFLAGYVGSRAITGTLRNENLQELDENGVSLEEAMRRAGYYEGGFTGPGDYRKEAGVVHAGEFVANHHAVNNPQLLPALQLIDQAQRNNTVASLTAADVSRAVGAGTTAFVAPVVNVNTDNEELNRVISDVATVVDSLNAILASGIKADVSIDGVNGLDAQYKRYKRLKG